jgi:signal transduction histidine kinase
MSDPSLNFESMPGVPLPRVANFVRQITHDVRNGLNAIELQSAYVGELAEPGEVRDELGKLRRMITHVTTQMQELAGRFAEFRPMLMSYPVEEFVEALKAAAQREFETQAKRIVWEMKLEEKQIEMDYSLLLSALLEVLRNAIFFREGDQTIHFTAWDEKGNAVFEVRQSRLQPVTGCEQWGRSALVSGRRGGYGLGLLYVRRILDTLGGALEPRYDAGAGELRVRLILPVKPAEQRASK